jgi:hypothetical protein
MDDERQQDVDMGENGDGEDDSSSSDEEVEMDPADVKLIMNLEKQLKASPSVYDTHVQVPGRRAAAAGRWYNRTSLNAVTTCMICMICAHLYRLSGT